MPVAQIIRLDERQAIARPRREPEQRPACVILELRATRKPRVKTGAPVMAMPDEDRSAGRGRDPG